MEIIKNRLVRIRAVSSNGLKRGRKIMKFTNNNLVCLNAKFKRNREKYEEERPFILWNSRLKKFTMLYPRIKRIRVVQMILRNPKGFFFKNFESYNKHYTHSIVYRKIFLSTANIQKKWKRQSRGKKLFNDRLKFAFIRNKFNYYSDFFLRLVKKNVKRNKFCIRNFFSINYFFKNKRRTYVRGVGFVRNNFINKVLRQRTNFKKGKDFSNEFKNEIKSRSKNEFKNEIKSKSKNKSKNKNKFKDKVKSKFKNKFKNKNKSKNKIKFKSKNKNKSKYKKRIVAKCLKVADKPVDYINKKSFKFYKNSLLNYSAKKKYFVKYDGNKRSFYKCVKKRSAFKNAQKWKFRSQFKFLKKNYRLSKNNYRFFYIFISKFIKLMNSFMTTFVEKLHGNVFFMVSMYLFKASMRSIELLCRGFFAKNAFSVNVINIIKNCNFFENYILAFTKISCASFFNLQNKLNCFDYNFSLNKQNKSFLLLFFLKSVAKYFIKRRILIKKYIFMFKKFFIDFSYIRNKNNFFANFIKNDKIVRLVSRRRLSKKFILIKKAKRFNKYIWRYNQDVRLLRKIYVRNNYKAKKYYKRKIEYYKKIKKYYKRKIEQFYKKKARKCNVEGFEKNSKKEFEYYRKKFRYYKEIFRCNFRFKKKSLNFIFTELKRISLSVMRNNRNKRLFIFKRRIDKTNKKFRKINKKSFASFNFFCNFKSKKFIEINKSKYKIVKKKVNKFCINSGHNKKNNNCINISFYFLRKMFKKINRNRKSVYYNKRVFINWRLNKRRYRRSIVFRKFVRRLKIKNLDAYRRSLRYGLTRKGIRWNNFIGKIYNIKSNFIINIINNIIFNIKIRDSIKDNIIYDIIRINKNNYNLNVDIIMDIIFNIINNIKLNENSIIDIINNVIYNIKYKTNFKKNIIIYIINNIIIDIKYKTSFKKIKLQ